MFWSTPEWNGLQLDGSKLQVSRANFGHRLAQAKRRKTKNTPDNPRGTPADRVFNTIHYLDIFQKFLKIDFEWTQD